ncbi:hypothetical protein [Phenylobacterium sp.]|uniref:hypothetical protein n=1 Tax=Phenylobacterium sp. TaxID=1871053 RepID=UPI0025DA2C0D|nr:hypothetical protein [Phenylobacterium sp.]MBX3482551.1 hypothetical protein [Phenylobacterium sp.]MCW5758759.1 hypothetical protein [Phenylobacterium sp.]
MRIFTTLDAQGETLAIAPGASFRTYWRRVETDAEAAQSGQPVGALMACEVAHPWDALDRWDEAVLARFAVAFEDVDDPPEPLPAEVPMYKVKKYMALRKVQTGGELDLHADVMAYIDALPEPNRTLARIDFGPDPEQIGSPNLVVHSPLALGAKAALGLSDEDYGEMIREAHALA